MTSEPIDTSAERVMQAVSDMRREAFFAPAEGGCEMDALRTCYGQFFVKHGQSLTDLLLERDALRARVTALEARANHHRQQMEHRKLPVWRHNLNAAREIVRHHSARTSGMHLMAAFDEADRQLAAAHEAKATAYRHCAEQAQDVIDDDEGSRGSRGSSWESSYYNGKRNALLEMKHWCEAEAQNAENGLVTQR